MKIGTKSLPDLYRIYTLSDPRDNEIRYVGITISSLVCRLGNHVRQSRAGEGTYKARWIRQLLLKGLKPEINLVEETGDFLRECFWIKQFKNQGARLVNTTDGARMGTHLSDEVKNRMKLFHQIHPQIFTAETKQKISAAITGRVVTQSTRNKLRIINSGRKFGPMPEENRKKIAMAKIGKSPTLNTRLKISATLKGRKLGLRVACCKHGHEYTLENTFINIRGNRECRTCLHLRDLKFHPRKTARRVIISGQK